MIDKLKAKVDYLASIGGSIIESPKLFLDGGNRVQETVSIDQIFAIKDTVSLGRNEGFSCSYYVLYNEIRVIEDIEEFYYWMLSKTDKYINDIHDRFNEYLDEV